MKTRGRLTDAYEAARVIEFDAETRMVFMSDQHRGDASGADEFAKNKFIVMRALDRYNAEGFTLAEIGDSEDLWEFPHVRHIVKAHSGVYDRLRKFFVDGRYLRLYGNHDAQLSDPTYVRANLTEAPALVTESLEPLFPGLEVLESLLLRHRRTGQEILVVHGHQGDFANDQNWRFTMTTFRAFWRWLHAFGISSPSSPIRNSYKRHKVERNYAKWIRSAEVALICGHTHRHRFPRADEVPYFNTGSCTFDGYVTAIELAEEQLTLVAWQVRPDAQGYLRVVRRVLAGPAPVSRYDRRRYPGLSAEAERARYKDFKASARRVPARRDATRPAAPAPRNGV